MLVDSNMHMQRPRLVAQSYGRSFQRSDNELRCTAHAPSFLQCAFIQRSRHGRSQIQNSVHFQNFNLVAYSFAYLHQ